MVSSTDHDYSEGVRVRSSTQIYPGNANIPIPHL